MTPRVRGDRLNNYSQKKSSRIWSYSINLKTKNLFKQTWKIINQKKRTFFIFTSRHYCVLCLTLEAIDRHIIKCNLIVTIIFILIYFGVISIRPLYERCCLFILYMSILSTIHGPSYVRTRWRGEMTVSKMARFLIAIKSRYVNQNRKNLFFFVFVCLSLRTYVHPYRRLLYTSGWSQINSDGFTFYDSECWWWWRYEDFSRSWETTDSHSRSFCCVNNNRVLTIKKL